MIAKRQTYTHTGTHAHTHTHTHSLQTPLPVGGGVIIDNLTLKLFHPGTENTRSPDMSQDTKSCFLSPRLSPNLHRDSVHTCVKA